MIYKYLRDDNRRLLEISSVREIYIKRVYTAQGILFECNNGSVLFTTSDKQEVIVWFETIK